MDESPESWSNNVAKQKKKSAPFLQHGFRQPFVTSNPNYLLNPPKHGHIVAANLLEKGTTRKVRRGYFSLNTHNLKETLKEHHVVF